MPIRLSRTTVERALNYSDHVQALLKESDALLESARATRVFADAVIRSVEELRNDGLEAGLDRIVALHRLKDGLATNANATRRELATLLSFMLKWLVVREPEPQGVAVGDTRSARQALIADLDRELANVIDIFVEERRREVEDARHRDLPPAPLAWREQVVCDRRAGRFYALGTAEAQAIPANQRDEFPSPEAAQLAGYTAG